MNIEILYFKGCPHHKPAVERIRKMLQQEGLPEARIVEIEVPDEEAARKLQFLGSPSIRVNGLDIEPAARTMRQFGLMCRTYGEGCCHSGLPSEELIRNSVRKSQTATAPRPEI